METYSRILTQGTFSMKPNKCAGYNFYINVYPDCAYLNQKNGGDIRPSSTLGRALQDCCKSGDNEYACRHVIEQFSPTFLCYKHTNIGTEITVATHADKIASCKAIYAGSGSTANFEESESTCDIYLLWEAAHSWRDNKL